MSRPDKPNCVPADLISLRQTVPGLRQRRKVQVHLAHSRRAQDCVRSCTPKCAQCSIHNLNPDAATQDQPQCDQFLPGFFPDNGNYVATCPARNVVSSDGKTCTGKFIEFSNISQNADEYTQPAPMGL
jgi:hypothetical protein